MAQDERVAQDNMAAEAQRAQGQAIMWGDRTIASVPGLQQMI
jgi:hypothetical protein